MTFFLLKKTDKQKLFFFTVYLMKVSGVQFCFDPEILQKCLILYSVKGIHTGFDYMRVSHVTLSFIWFIYTYLIYTYTALALAISLYMNYSQVKCLMIVMMDDPASLEFPSEWNSTRRHALMLWEHFHVSRCLKHISERANLIG